MIREFHPEDIQSVCAVLNGCLDPDSGVTISSKGFRRTVLNSEEWSKARAFVAIQNDQIKGFAAVVLAESSACVAFLHVHPLSRRLGIGSKLLRRVEAVSEENGRTALLVGGYALGSPFHGVDARDTQTAVFLLKRGYDENFRQATRQLQLPAADTEGNAGRQNDSEYKIRIVTESDTDYASIRKRIVALCQRCEPGASVFATIYEGERVDENNAYIAVVFDGQSLIGFAGFAPFQDLGIGYEAYPQWGPILVCPNHRNQGIGRSLLVMSLTKMADLGCDRAVLVGVDSGPAAHLYKSSGFETVASWVEYRKQLGEGSKI